MPPFNSLTRLMTAAVCGISSGALQISSQGTLFCEKEKYEAWHKTWRIHREKNAIPGWDPGSPTTATAFLDTVDDDANHRIRKILVPLCGASYDMDFIQRHFRSKYPDRNTEIIGIELSRDAIEMFLERVSNEEYDPSGKCSIEHQGDITIYRYDNYCLICADIFDDKLDELEVLRDIDLIYDKEALAALPPKKWHLYIEFCERIMNQNGRILFSAWRYDTNQRDIEQRYIAPHSFGYHDANDLVNLYKTLFQKRSVDAQLLYSENWRESKDLKDHMEFKANALGIRGSAFTDVWLLHCNM